MPRRPRSEAPRIRADGGDAPEMNPRRREIQRRDPKIRADAAEFALLGALSESGDWLTADQLVEAVTADLDGDVDENIASILWGLWNRTLIESRAGEPPAYRITEAGALAVERITNRLPDG